MLAARAQAGASIDLKDGEGNTPVLYACTNGQVETCRVLLEGWSWLLFCLFVVVHVGAGQP